MNQKERTLILVVLSVVAVMVTVDLITDSREGVVLWHVLVEGAIGASALFGIFYLLKDSFKVKHQLEHEQEAFSNFRKEAESWRQESRKFIEGLSLAIDQQLSRWGLTQAEKEVALLLLKGLSLKEVAEVRNTSEKTARIQSQAVYSKSGLSGRSELAAFFLEDLLVPAPAAESKN